MTTNHVIRIVTTPALVFIFISAAFAGGWAIVTLDDFPEYAVAGKPVNLTFAVRQHGVTSLPALKVIAPGAPAPAPFAPPTRGLRLFRSKGCSGCHRHIEVNPERVTDAKFDLTGKRFPQDYLKKFLADPSIKPAEMPNLKLKNDEVEALAAFINKLASKTREEVQR